MELRAFADVTRGYAFLTLGPDKTILRWNKAAELLLGYSEAEILGRSGHLFFTPEDIELGAPGREAATALREGGRRGTLAPPPRRDHILG